MMDLRCEAVAMATLGQPSRRSGAELFFRCPNHEDKHPSLQVNIRKNAFLCGPCGKCGNAWCLAAFIARIEPSDKKAVAAWLRDRGLLDASNANDNHNTRRATSDEPKPDFVRVAEFYYGPDLRKIRLERPSANRSKREKSFRWEHREGDSWKSGDGGLQKPLYANQLFRERDQVGMTLGFEGEAKTDLAGKMGFAAFSFKNLNAAHCDALAGLDAVLWPDADAPGFKQANEAAKIMYESQQPRLIRMIIPPPELPISGDIVDAVRSLGWGRAEIEKLIAEAKTFPPEPERPLIEELLMGLATDVQPKAVHWLWAQRIPENKLVSFAGDPDVGKSTVIYDIVARYTTGRDWPDAKNTNPPGEVIMFISEDDLEDTVVPRLIAAGADLSKIHFAKRVQIRRGATKEERTLALATDLDLLRKKLEEFPNVRLVTFDPITDYLGKGDQYKDAEVRRVLIPVREFAEENHITIIGSGHFNKRSDVTALHRVGGAVAIVAVPRAAWLFVKDPDDPELFKMLRGKANLSKKRSGLKYRIVEKMIPLPDKSETGVPVIAWEGETSDDAEAAMTVDRDPDARKVAKAEHFLRKHFEEYPGLQPSAPIIEEAQKEHGISESTLHRARRKMKNPQICVSRPAGIWSWEPKNGQK